MKDKLLARVENYYKQYEAYNTFFENYMEGIKEKEAEFTKILEDKPTVKQLKELGMELYVLKFQYAQDLQILADKFVTTVDTIAVTDIKIPVEFLDLAKKLRPALKKTNFVIEKNQPVEKEIGFVEKLKTNVNNSGQLDVMLEDLINQRK